MTNLNRTMKKKILVLQIVARHFRFSPRVVFISRARLLWKLPGFERHKKAEGTCFRIPPVWERAHSVALRAADEDRAVGPGQCSWCSSFSSSVAVTICGIHNPFAKASRGASRGGERFCTTRVWWPLVARRLPRPLGGRCSLVAFSSAVVGLPGPIATRSTSARWSIGSSCLARVSIYPLFHPQAPRPRHTGCSRSGTTLADVVMLITIPAF
jgi:hypothetical protein